MKQPVTELDTRFSDQDAVATDWEETRRALEDAELFWISTVRADGRPHVTPLVAVWLDDAIYFATGPGEQKAVNLGANQNVILTTGCNEWERGLDVVVEGEAVQVMDESVLERLAATWATKWDGRWHYEVHDCGFRHEASETGDHLTARLRFERRQVEVEGSGNGPIAALIDALGSLGVEIGILDYHEHALGSGGDAAAAAYVEADVDGELLWGAGIHSSIVTASLRAVINAVNRGVVAQRRQALVLQEFEAS